MRVTRSQTAAQQQEAKQHQEATAQHQEAATQQQDSAQQTAQEATQDTSLQRGSTSTLETTPAKRPRKRKTQDTQDPEDAKGATPKKPRRSRKGKEVVRDTAPYNLLGLPREMWLCIFQFLYPSEALQLTLVSKDFFHLVDELYSWHHIHQAAELPAVTPKSRKCKTLKAMVLFYSDVICEQCLSFCNPTAGHAAARPLPVHLAWNPTGRKIRLCQPCRRDYFAEYPEHDIPDPVKSIIPSRDGVNILTKHVVKYYRLPFEIINEIPADARYHARYGTPYYLFHRASVAQAAAEHHGGFIGLREEFLPFKVPRFRRSPRAQRAMNRPSRPGPKTYIARSIAQKEQRAATKAQQQQQQQQRQEQANKAAAKNAEEQAPGQMLQDETSILIHKAIEGMRNFKVEDLVAGTSKSLQELSAMLQEIVSRAKARTNQPAGSSSSTNPLS